MLHHTAHGVVDHYPVIGHKTPSPLDAVLGHAWAGQLATNGRQGYSANYHRGGYQLAQRFALAPSQLSAYTQHPSDRFPAIHGDSLRMRFTVQVVLVDNLLPGNDLQGIANLFHTPSKVGMTQDYSPLTSSLHNLDLGSLSFVLASPLSNTVP